MKLTIGTTGAHDIDWDERTRCRSLEMNERDVKAKSEIESIA